MKILLWWELRGDYLKGTDEFELSVTSGTVWSALRTIPIFSEQVSCNSRVGLVFKCDPIKIGSSEVLGGSQFGAKQRHVRFFILKGSQPLAGG